MTTVIRIWSGRLAALLTLLVLFVGLPGQALALENRKGDAIVVPTNETIDDDLFAAGQTVTIAGRVQGDVYAFAQNVVVTGTIDGDLIAAGQQVRIDGTVGGDVRAAGSQVTINGQVGGNVTAAASQISVSSNGRIDGSLLGGASSLDLFGPIGRTLTFGASSADLAGPVGGNVQAGVETLTIEPSARIGGALEYRSEREASIPPGTVAGPVNFVRTERDEPRAPQPDPLNGLFGLGGLIWLFGTAVLGTLAITLLPDAAERVVLAGRQRPLQSFGLGLAALLLIPIAALFVAITIIGLPLMLAVSLLYGLGLLLAWPALGLLLGLLIGMLVRRGQRMHNIWALLLGLVILHLATHLPYLGGLLGFLGLAFGLGLVIQAAMPRRSLPPAAQLSTAAA
jgi:cytoskeletal protein CcmA (bactofilin family)